MSTPRTTNGWRLPVVLIGCTTLLVGCALGCGFITHLLYRLFLLGWGAIK